MRNKYYEYVLEILNNLLDENEIAYSQALKEADRAFEKYEDAFNEYRKNDTKDNHIKALQAQRDDYKQEIKVRKLISEQWQLRFLLAVEESEPNSNKNKSYIDEIIKEQDRIAQERISKDTSYLDKIFQNQKDFYNENVKSDKIINFENYSYTNSDGSIDFETILDNMEKTLFDIDKTVSNIKKINQKRNKIYQELNETYKEKDKIQKEKDALVDELLNKIRDNSGLIKNSSSSPSQDLFQEIKDIPEDSEVNELFKDDFDYSILKPKTTPSFISVDDIENEDIFSYQDYQTNFPKENKETTIDSEDDKELDAALDANFQALCDTLDKVDKVEGIERGEGEKLYIKLFQRDNIDDLSLEAQGLLFYLVRHMDIHNNIQISKTEIQKVIDRYIHPQRHRLSATWVNKVIEELINGNFIEIHQEARAIYSRIYKVNVDIAKY
jgi:hypothetical protein